MTSSVRVCIVSEYPFSLMTGGMQVQARETFAALRALGVPVEWFDWVAECAPADLYHFIGLPPYLARLAALVRAAGKPYVCTVLCGRRPGLVGLTAAQVRHFLKTTVLREREYHEALKRAAAVVAITPSDGWVLQRIFGIATERLHVIPNGADDAFRTASALEWCRQYGHEPFVLCVGAVQPRKNQLLLLQASNIAALPVVLLGPILPGQDRYAQRVEEEAAINVRYGGHWLRHLQQDDPLLRSAFAACRVFVLLSHTETQPLSVLQAMAARRPILLGDADYAREYPFDRLPKTADADPSTLAGTLRVAWEEERTTELPPEFSWRNAAAALQSLYAQILSR